MASDVWVAGLRRSGQLEAHGGSVSGWKLPRFGPVTALAREPPVEAGEQSVHPAVRVGQQLERGRGVALGALRVHLPKVRVLVHAWHSDEVGLRRLAVPVPAGYVPVSDGWHLMHSAVMCRPSA